MQGRYGNVRASARSHFIGPGLLRQQHAKRSYPNPVTSIAINSESSARKPATKAMGNVNHSKVANDDLEDERVDHAWKKWGVNINRATGEPVYDSDHGSEYDSEYESEYDSEHENEYSEDSFEDENMTAREKNLSLKTSRLLDKDMQPKKMKSMNEDAATSRRGDYDEARDSARVSNAENNMDATEKADRTEEKRGRGKNKCKKVAKLKPGEKTQQAIKNYPRDFPQADCEWLVKEHFYSKEFIARSKRNSINRSNLTILHHSGSKPYRKVIYDNDGKDSNPPTLDALFFMTHTKGGSFMDSESSSKHAQLEEQLLSDPSLSNAQLMDKCFPSKRQDHIVGFGGGVKARHLRSPSISKAELMQKLKQSEDEKRAMEEENRELREETRAANSRVSRIEKEWEELKNKLSSN